MKKLYMVMFSLLVMMVVFGHDCKKVEAGSVKALDKTAEVDITGDGKKDKIKIKTTKEDGYIFRKYSIYINGKKAYTQKLWAYNLGVEHVKVSAKESYLYVWSTSENAWHEFADLLQYKKGKLVKVNDLQHGSHEIQVKSVSKKKLVVSCREQYSATGYLSYDVVYKKKNKKWVKLSDEYKVTAKGFDYSKPQFQSKKEIKLYKSASCTGAYSQIPKGKTFTLIKIRRGFDSDGELKVYGYFKCGKKKGWMDIENYEKSLGVFKGVMLAG